MPQDPDISPVAHARPGAIRPRRGTNWFAIASFGVGLVLAIGAALLIALYKAAPNQHGYDTIAFLLAAFVGLGMLINATYIGAPIGLICAIIAIFVARDRPQRRGNGLIRISILLLLVDIGVVAGADHLARNKIAKLQYTASHPAIPPQAAPPKLPYTEEAEAGWKVAQYCQIYSAQHDGNYPQSLEDVYNSIRSPDPLMRKYDFYYVGGGLRIIDRSDPTIARVIILIANQRLADGSRLLIGVDGAVTTVSSTQELGKYIERNNEVRERHNWPQISYTADD